MVFSSFYFLLYFLPLFFLSYYLIDFKYKNLCLFLYSIGFYAFGCFDNMYYVLILIASLLINYLLAIVIENLESSDTKNSTKKNKNHLRTLLLVIALILNFGNLFLFKYYNFFIQIISSINKNINITKSNLLLPIGISFYTFQIVSYTIDVYFKKIKAEKNFIDFGTYVIMFPQLIAGPIVRFIDVQKEIKSKRKIDYKKIYDGFSIFVIGLASKVLVANQLSLVQVDISNTGIEMLSLFGAWMGAISYSMQMYFDFFGYSLMAIGLGKMIGITIVENFKDPFLSTSVEEYWRRWHISLGTWFRDYLMYPILFSKKVKKMRSFLSKSINTKFANFIVNLFATFVVWFATGLWHGANYNFIMWGLYFFVFMILEQLILSKTILKIKPIAHIYLCIVIIISFVIFSNENLSDMNLYFKKMFYVNTELINDTFHLTITNNLRAIIIGVLCVLRVPNLLYSYIKKNVVANSIVILILFGLSIFFIYLGYNDPFMYFRF